MKKHHRHQYIRIVRSCLTGKAVWIYQGSSVAGAKLAYWKACKKEVKRVRMWMQKVNERRRNLRRFISECTASLPLTVELTLEQKDSAHELQFIDKDNQSCHREFYDHIMEEARRYNESSARWKSVRNKWLGRKK